MIPCVQYKEYLGLNGLIDAMKSIPVKFQFLVNFLSFFFAPGRLSSLLYGVQLGLLSWNYADCLDLAVAVNILWLRYQGVWVEDLSTLQVDMLGLVPSGYVHCGQMTVYHSRKRLGFGEGKKKDCLTRETQKSSSSRLSLLLGLPLIGHLSRIMAMSSVPYKELPGRYMLSTNQPLGIESRSLLIKYHPVK